MGSGSLAAMSVFESRWVPEYECKKGNDNNRVSIGLTDALFGLQREQAIELVQDAIEAGIFNDLGSGSNVDVCVITKEKTEYLRNYAKPNERGIKEKSYKYKRGTTDILKESIRNLVEVTEGDAMDTSL